VSGADAQIRAFELPPSRWEVEMDEREQAAVRERFLTALDDPKDPAWSRLLEGDGKVMPLTWTVERHPFGHECGTCKKWRTESRNRGDGMAELEQQVLDEREAPTG
jgi:hypothetical protein